jgi:hypothetical protein
MNNPGRVYKTNPISTLFWHAHILNANFISIIVWRVASLHGARPTLTESLIFKCDQAPVRGIRSPFERQIAGSALISKAPSTAPKLA